MASTPDTAGDDLPSPTPKRYSLPRMAFLPLSEDAPLTTRGQSLQGLIKNLSSTDLARKLSTTYPRSILSDADDVEAQSRSRTPAFPEDEYHKRLSAAMAVLNQPQIRSQRLIGNSNPRYKWEQYWKTDEELKKMKKPIRKYYERNNYLIQQYAYIDRLLDSSLPHNLIQEYGQRTNEVEIPSTISEESSSAPDTPMAMSPPTLERTLGNGFSSNVKVKRTKSIYKIPEEETPLLVANEGDPEHEEQVMPAYEPEEETDNQSPIVNIAILVNFVANTLLLIMKIIVAYLTSSLSVLASLVDAALDFLSTAIIFVTTRMIAHQDQYAYPVGRRRLEPLGVLVFSVIMITAFAQVAIEGFQRFASGEHTVVQLTIPAIVIMASTVGIKFLCWLWCRLIKNSSVQALAQDAMTDVVFNTFSIIFPLIGFYAKLWWLDPVGGIVLSFYVIINWSRTSTTHIRNLTGRAASADERNVLLYLTMRFAKTIKKVQGLSAYHAGDKLIVEVDIVLDEHMSLRDSHDLSESLQYVLESVPIVDRAFVHTDYMAYNISSHMLQQQG